MEVGLKGFAPKKEQMELLADDPDVDVTAAPAAPVPKNKKPSGADLDPSTVVFEEDDDDGFQVYRPRKSVYFDTRVKNEQKENYVIGKLDLNAPFATPLSDLTPQSRMAEQDFRLRMQNRFEPSAEVANLVRAGASVLPTGSQRSVKGIPAASWMARHAAEGFSSHPQSYISSDMQDLMTLDVGLESRAALMDSDVDSDESVDLSSESDEEVKNIKALQHKADGTRPMTDFFKVLGPKKRDIPSLATATSVIPAQPAPILISSVVPFSTGFMSFYDEKEFAIDELENELFCSTNSDLMGLCGCSTIQGQSENECLRCFQCSHCCDCVGEHNRLLAQTCQEQSMFCSYVDHFSRHGCDDSDDDSDDVSDDDSVVSPRQLVHERTVQTLVLHNLLDENRAAAQDFGVARRR